MRRSGWMEGVRFRFMQAAAVVLLFSVCLAGSLRGEEGAGAQTRIVLDNRAEVAASLRRGLRNHARQMRISFTARTEALGRMDFLIEELLEEALAETDDPREGDYIRFQYGGYEQRIRRENVSEGYRYTVTIIPNYYTYLVQEQQVDEWVEDIISSFYFAKTTDEIDKIRTIYNYVYENISFDEVHKNKASQHLKTTAYAALRYHTAVCQGFSVLMYRLLREAGIRTRVITGQATLASGEQEFHAWNIVELDGEFYNLDATWGKELETEDYYMKSDADFLYHVRDEKYRTEEFEEAYPMAEKSYR